MGDGHGSAHGNTHAGANCVPSGRSSRGVAIPFYGFRIEDQDLGHAAVFVVAKVGSIGISIISGAQTSPCIVVGVGKNRTIVRRVPSRLYSVVAANLP